MNLIFILSFVFIAVSSLCAFLFLMLRRAEDPAVKRIVDLKNGLIVLTSKTKSVHLSDAHQIANENIEKILTIISRFVKHNKEKISRIRQALIYSGHRREASVQIFLGLRMLSATCFFCFFFFLGQIGERPLSTIFLLSCLVAVVGYRFPDIVLNRQIRKRQGKIAQSLPDALDLLVISVEAGLGLNAALLRVGNDLALRCPPMADEFMRVNQDLRTGISREEALRNLGCRNRVDDLRILVSALILADRLGTSIADTLRAQADSLRTRIRQKAEEQAAKAGIKMLLPLILFILPALIIILMGPGLISVYRTFQQ